MTLQGIAVQQDQFLVPTLDGTVVRVSPNGAAVTLVDLLKANLGVPFAINPAHTDGTASEGSVIVTVSSYLPDHYLVRVKPDGTYVKLADLTQVCTDSGAPFGVAADQQGYVVALSTDVVEATAQIVRVNAAGTITQRIKLDEKGNPFGVAVHNGELLVAQSKGLLLRVSQGGKVTKIVDLQQAGFGIPFYLAIQGDRAIVTTNLGWVAAVDLGGNVAALSAKGTSSEGQSATRNLKEDATQAAKGIINVGAAKYGIPSGIAVYQNDLIVTTNSGYVLRLSAKE